MKTLGGWGDPTGETYTAPQTQEYALPQSPTVVLSTSDFQLQSLEPKQLSPSHKLLLNEGPSEPCCVIENNKYTMKSLKNKI